MGVQPSSPARKADLLAALQAAQADQATTGTVEDEETGTVHRTVSQEEHKAAPKQQTVSSVPLERSMDATRSSKASTHSHVRLLPHVRNPVEIRAL